MIFSRRSVDLSVVGTVDKGVGPHHSLNHPRSGAFDTVYICVTFYVINLRHVSPTFYRPAPQRNFRGDTKGPPQFT